MKKIFKILISSAPFILLFSCLIYRSFNFEGIAIKSFYDDEAQYTEISKNFLKTNQWLVPLSGGPDDPQQIHFIKLENGNYLSPSFLNPPLHPQIIAVFFKIFGIGEFFARLPSLIFSLLSLILMYLIGLKLFKSKLAAFISIILFSFSNDFSYLSSHAIPEAQLLFFSLSSVYFLFFKSKKFIILSALFLSLGFLTKSFAVFWIYPIALYLFAKNKTSLREIFIYWIIPQIILIIPWHLYINSFFGPNFLRSYFFNNLQTLKQFFIIIPFSLILGLSISFLIRRHKILGTVLFLLLSLYLHNTTALLALNRTDSNIGVSRLGLTYTSLPSLTVYKIPYESPLFYFDTGQIYQGLNNNAQYLLTNKDYLNELNPKIWQLVDTKQSTFLLKKIHSE